ncbi:MAG: FIG001454: Transglutaminase-like enzymes, putative cysteine proteases [uncultured Chthoniobacterales bacterium]|uniref:FIG001454: Transglutaminase-like enzymes, putative cysteine proteases n=1 Tax=uncultured Chthoniobacterales bacterium TaxID=1836801 RepID=A0A6J4I9N7_9BACT|nr:MAG: FIG001454: Transglutaminase-like enzymes, putative cysteine proteases [uncultured Chthoniobacterales bacterium]
MLKVILATATLGAIAASYGSLRGIEPGVSLLVVLMSLKVLEAHTAREFQVMVLVGWVLCLCGFIMSQDLANALSLLTAFALVNVALIQFHRGSARGALWPPLRTAGKLIGQALPLIALLFLFFPRISTGFRFPLMDSASASAGFSDELSPGSVTSLANSTDVAFRAEFPDGKLPPRAAMYWRGAMMWEGAGFDWKAPAFPASLPAETQRTPAAEAVRQRITIEPHQSRWMFALDWPAHAPLGASLAPGNYIRSFGPIRKARQYEVVSYGEIAQKELHPRELPMYTAVPDSISAAVRELAQSWTAADPNPRAVLKKALEHFQTQGFRYSISPGTYDENGLDDFLFKRRVGFCEHYAGSFATLMRLAGVPARVVTGYLGGEFNAYGRFFIVRQSDAHAWCEVWLPDIGWQRVDVTGVVAPDRVNLGFLSFLERRAASGEERLPVSQSALSGRMKRWPLVNDVSLAWDSLNYAWDTRVLGFDAAEQQQFFSAMQLSDTTPIALLIRAAMIALAFVALYAIWMRWSTRARGDPVRNLYERFCEKAARVGARRSPAEGPRDFSARAVQLVPAESQRIERITDAYIALRYSARPAAALLDQLAADVTAFGRSRAK